MKHQSKLSQKQEHVAEQQLQANMAKEFTSSDELLRHDAAQTVVPPEIAERLKRTTAAAGPPPQSSWFKRIFLK
jgi:hypothetical protein